MATRKKAKKTPGRSKSIKPPAKGTVASLPSGYKVIGRAPAWDPEEHPVLEGERGEDHAVTFDKGTPKERTARTCVVQDDALGAVALWESSTLRDFFDQTKAGDYVRIEFLGMGEAKKGQNAPKLFSCAIKE